MRILLAEDESSLSKALTAILTKNNFSVDTVFDGNEAEGYILTGDYDCVILDVMMPGQDGFEVLRKVRRKGNTTPILMLTAKSQIDDKVEGLDLGANDYMTKPFDSKELMARIRAITRNAISSTNNILKYGNISLNRNNFELSSPSSSVTLASKEYQILEYLMLNQGMLISTERFMDKIWELDYDGDSSILFTNLSYLRKKLTKIGANVKIKATRNAGYTLEAE